MKMSTKFTCRFCKEKFDVPKGLYKHLQLAHNAGVSKDNRTCPICGVTCSKYEGYRDHLLYIHGQTDDGQKLTFKSLNEFLVWKTELELKHNCKYVLQTSPKVLPTKEKKYFYQCDRSDSKTKDKKSSVVMKTCSSVISVVEGTGVFVVEYWDTHSGHEVSSAQSVQNELEAAISSVEMVNAIADSDDSFDKPTELLIPEDSSPSVSNIEKQTFLIKTNSTTSNNSPIANTAQKTKTVQLGKFDGTKKKNSNTSILYSLASVACGKGISKKSVKKVNESKNANSQSISKPGLQITTQNVVEKANHNSSTFGKSKDDSDSQEVSADNCISEESTVKVTAAATSSKLTTNKTTASGPPAIAPKITSVSGNNMNSLFTTNNAYPNQLVIMNPVTMDQNSLNSSQNVFTTGQNILFSLGPIGQNVVPTNTSQTVNQIPLTGEKRSGGNAKVTKGESSSKVHTSNALTAAKNSLTGAQSSSNSAISTLASSVTNNSPITLTTGMNSAPVILSSLPVGSTFMSVNNNLIPIASPSGAYIPTSLPPNIVLAPVVPGIDSSNTTASSVNSASSTPQNIQTQGRFSAPSTIAITVSSIVKEPVYTSSAIKHMSNIVTSSTSPVSSTSTQKNSRLNTQNKFVPIAIAGKVSPNKNANKSVSSPKNTFSLNRSKVSSNAVAYKTEVNSASSLRHTSQISTPSVSNKFMSDLASTPKPSARKRITKGIKPKPAVNPISNIVTANTISSTVNTKVVNSQLNLAPISSTPDVTITPQLNIHKPGTLLFESSGDIYMLEPVENDPAPVIDQPVGNELETATPLKSVPLAQTSKILIDRSIQTSESCLPAALKSKFQRKRAAPPTDDSAVMLKVKCYQLEMKYLNSQTECKRLKVELTKERLKNAELSGTKTPLNLEEETHSELSRINASEIMKEIEDKFNENKDVNIYTMTKTSVLRSLYEDLEELCIENGELYKELENYRAHDKFYKSLKKRLYDEEF